MPSPEELVGQFFKRFANNDKPNGYVTLPYISGITDALRRTLLKQNIGMTTRPLKTLQRICFLPLNIKFHLNNVPMSFTVYLVPIAHGQMLVKQEDLSKLGKRNILEMQKGSNIAKHAWDEIIITKLTLSVFENGKVIDSGNYRTRKTLESWHTALITNSDNNSKSLPKCYTLIRKICNR